MSHGAAATQNMAFNNPRSLNTLGNGTISDQKSTNANGSFNNNLRARPNAWGSSSIWSGGITNGLTTTAGTRDTSTSRDSVQQSSSEFEGKTGSGSLVDSSVSEDYSNHRSTWGSKRSAPPVRSMSTTQYGDSHLPQQRSVSNAGLPQNFPGANQNLAPFASRPPTISLNSTSSSTQQPRQSLASTYGNSFASQSSEQPPFNIYTKFNRPSEPSRKIPDSAVGSWAEPATTPSPSDERLPHFPIQTNRSGSFPTSRETSLPPSRHADQQPMFSRPDYSRPSQRATPTSSRAPSISSARNGIFNTYLSNNADQMAAQLGHLNLNGDGRPSTSYKPTATNNGYSGLYTSSLVRPSQNAFPNGSMDQAEDIEEIDRANMSYLGLDDYAPAQQLTNGSGYSGGSFAERYLQSGNTYEFRPGQPYTGSGVSPRPYDLPNGSRTPSEWQGHPNGSLSVNRRSPGVPDQQAYLDPRVQQLMAAQLRNQYAAAMYSPYALNPLQLNAASPYMGLIPMGFSGMETAPASRDAPVGDGVQSALMYEFKSNTKTKRYELRDIYDHIAEFSGDQHGSRFIQTKLETANSDEKDRVFREIEPNAIPLMTDVFGNYVIQKFFEHGDQTHKKIIANKMRGQVLQLSLQMYGCRVVQKALDHVLVDQQALLIGELEGHVLKCVKDQNGNHVIQKAIERCPSPTIGFIISAFQGQVQHLSIHPYGCRVIQRCLEKCDLPSKAMIMSELMEGIQTMISDQFGNYVVQHIVSHDDGEPKRRVLAIVMHNLEGYSKHKFASNVVEKCLERSDDHWRRQVVATLNQATKRIEGEAVLVAMIRDSFGNYVIQKLLDTLSSQDFAFFLEILQPAVALAKRAGCGKQVLSIEKKMHRFDTYRNGSISGGPTFNRPGFQLPLPPPSFASNYNSAANTPPPLTADTQSLQSSGIPSVNGDTVEGAAASRKCSEHSTDAGFPRQ
ncbi:Pumilio 2 [Lecanosticta acicola]|uniref:Pumilio homology domain family member 3 n=1 Tax=Lecanosticta acicola TaxID=111012 RepID=A0AAI8YTJ2_9PEZI|nr:Pumilio 2 [Lecanosticta acicola]